MNWQRIGLTPYWRQLEGTARDKRRGARLWFKMFIVSVEIEAESK